MAPDLHFPQFRDLARHADAGNAFVRRRKLPLPTLVAIMPSGMRKSVQTELDEFFAHLKQQAQLVHHVSKQAFAKARAKLSTTAIPALNDWLVARADADGFVPRWRGRRLVAADASTLGFGRRASHEIKESSPLIYIEIAQYYCVKYNIHCNFIEGEWLVRITAIVITRPLLHFKN